MGYLAIAHAVLLYLLVRVWILHGIRIPMLCIAVWLTGYFLAPRIHPQGFPLFTCLLAAALAIVDKFKSTPWSRL